MGVYKFVEPSSIFFKTNLVNRSFENDWIKIYDDGNIIVNPKKYGYAWDGCSPKFNMLDLTFGTPDGKMELETKKPITYYASMLHDAIYQFKDEIPISRKEADKLFYLVLRDRRFFWSKFYYFFVSIFGIFYGKWKVRNGISDVEFDSFTVN